jgi:hypothetical protein
LPWREDTLVVERVTGNKESREKKTQNRTPHQTIRPLVVPKIQDLKALAKKGRSFSSKAIATIPTSSRTARIGTP